MPSSSDLARLYDDHAQALFAFLLDFTGNPADARDLLQEVYVRVAGLTDDAIDIIRSERGFLVCMARRLAIDHARRCETRQRNNRSYSELHEFQSTALPHEADLDTALTQAMAELPLEQREVVHLKMWSGLTFAEISEALEIPPNTAASRYRYGIDKLRGLLRPLYNEIK